MVQKRQLLLANPTASNLPNAQTYDQLIKLLINRINPTPNEIQEHHKFLLTLQREGEGIGIYIAELKRLVLILNVRIVILQE